MRNLRKENFNTMKTKDLEKLIARATPLPWSLPHLSDPSMICKCGHILCDNLMGAVATVHVADSENLGDDPERPQAEANGALLHYAANNILRIQRERDAALEALKFYADKEKWDDIETGIGCYSGEAMDYGAKARAALAQIEKGEK